MQPRQSQIALKNLLRFNTVASGTTEASANKHGSVVPEGTLDFLVFEPSVKTLGYYQRKGTLNRYTADKPFLTQVSGLLRELKDQRSKPLASSGALLRRFHDDQ